MAKKRVQKSSSWTPQVQNQSLKQNAPQMAMQTLPVPGIVQEQPQPQMPEYTPAPEDWVKNHSLLRGLAVDNSEATSMQQLGGLKSNIQEEEAIGGRTVGETLGDIGRPMGTDLGNLVGSVAGALTGITISSTTNVGPTWSHHGRFYWEVGFSTSGRSGWIVQKIVNTYRAETAAGAPAPGARPTPEYWEAWAVDASGNVSPSIGATNDMWARPSKGPSTQGHWSMTGSVYFTTTDPATQGFTPGGVPDAGILLSTTSAPSGLGVARLHRYAQGTWDSTGATPTHTGSAS